jgi:hypothetical protein
LGFVLEAGGYALRVGCPTAAGNWDPVSHAWSWTHRPIVRVPCYAAQSTS